MKVVDTQTENSPHVQNISSNKMPRLPDNLRSEAIGMIVAGMTPAAVARRLNCHKTTIARLVQRFQATGSVKDRQRPGQPKITTH